MTGWLKKPRIEHPPQGRRLGRPQTKARIAKDNPWALTLKTLLEESGRFSRQPWARYRVKDGDKGPMVWEVKHALIYRPEGKGLSDKRWHLLIARNPLKPEEVKYSLSNGAASTSV